MCTTSKPFNKRITAQRLPMSSTHVHNKKTLQQTHHSLDLPRTATFNVYPKQILLEVPCLLLKF